MRVSLLDFVCAFCVQQNKISRWCLALMSILLLGLSPQSQASTALKKQIAVSIYPLYLLTKSVTEGIETPVLLIPKNQDLHHSQLSPKQVLQMRQSDLVLWLGAPYEPRLATTLLNQPNAVAFLSQKNLRVLRQRDTKGQTTSVVDPHFWLDPDNVIKTAYWIAMIRGIQYPENKTRYLQNASQLARKMNQLIATQQPKIVTRYWSSHDAYHYLEATFKLEYAGSLALDETEAILPAQLLWLKQSRPHPRCLLSNHALDPRVLSTLLPIQSVILKETMQEETDFTQAMYRFSTTLDGCRAP